MSFVRLPLPMKRTAVKFAYGVAASVLFACLLVFLASVSTAQDTGTADTADARRAQTDKKTYVSENGTQTITQALETERQVTSDGEVEIQRFRSPSWAGDQTVTWEREVRTKKLPDGTIEKEYVMRSPDGARQLTPVQVIHEKITPGKDSSTIERETLQFDDRGHWQPVQKETVTEKGADTAKQIVKEVQQTDTTGAWQVVERQISSTRTSAVGKETQKETQSVRQILDAFGRLADYERREERTATNAGEETQEVTLQRRDISNTDSRQFFLVEHTKTQSTTTEPGNTTRHIVTESDLLPGSTMRNFDSTHSEIVEERTEVETTAPDGTKQTAITASSRSAGDPTAVRPAYTVVQQTDQKGYVRQIFIPAQ